MKSFFAALPLLGLAVAESPSCPGTVTVTYTPTYTLTLPTSSASICPADTVTVTYTPTVYVTLPAGSTSASPVGSSAVPFYPLPNATYHASAYPTAVPTIPYDVDSSMLPSSSAKAEVPTSPAEVYSSSIPTIAAPSYPPYEPSAAAAAATSKAAASAAPSISPATGASTAAISDSKSGEATYYGGNVAGGMCSFTGYTIPAGIYGTALSDTNWAGAQNCGACVSVKGPNGNSIKAMVVDQCPGCGPNHLDLFPTAFSSLAEPSKGIIPISWSIVPCGITTPIILKNKEGTSPYWFSMQVMNANVPVAKLEVSIDGGKTWTGTTRQPYNFFEKSSGFGTQNVDVKVTSVNGGVVVVKGVSISAGTTKKAESNFA